MTSRAFIVLAALITAWVLPASAQGTRNAEAQKKARCESYSRQLESIRKAERAGGTAKALDRLNEQRRAINAAQFKAGC